MKMPCIRWEEHCTNICVLAKAVAISTKILPCVTVQLQIPKMFSAEYDQVPYSKGYPAHTEDVSLEDRGTSGSWKTSIKCQSALKRNSLFWKIKREHFESHIQTGQLAASSLNGSGVTALIYGSISGGNGELLQISSSDQKIISSRLSGRLTQPENSFLIFHVHSK